MIVNLVGEHAILTLCSFHCLWSSVVDSTVIYSLQVLYVVDLLRTEHIQILLDELPWSARVDVLQLCHTLGHILILGTRLSPESVSFINILSI